MATKPATISAYLAALPPERRKEFREIRTWVRKVLPKARETMGYRMPTYESAGESGQEICAIAAQKHYFSLYVCASNALDPLRHEFSHLDVGKCCIRFKNFAVLPRGAARRVLLASAREANQA